MKKLKNQNPKQKIQNQLNPNNELELSLLKLGFNRVIGIDEVGRGAWAGSVVVGSYIYNLESKLLEGVNDSKLLTKKKREALYNTLDPATYSIEIGDLNLVDTLGVGKTIIRLIEKVVIKFDDGNTYFLIDGVFGQDFSRNSQKIIKGDRKHYSIAIASIAAKVYRDSVMSDLAKKYRGYYFEKNVGYGTSDHREALKLMGPCKIHRTSFRPIAELI